MVIISFFLLSIVGVVLQTTVFQLLPAWMGKPDLLFILVVFLAYRLNMVRGVPLVFFIGLLMDTLSGAPLGIYSISYLLVFIALRLIVQHNVFKEAVYQVPLTALGYLAASSGIFIASAVLAPDNLSEWSWGVMLLHALLLAVLAIPFFGLNDVILTLITRKSISRLVPKSKPINRFRS